MNSQTSEYFKSSVCEIKLDGLVINSHTFAMNAAAAPKQTGQYHVYLEQIPACMSLHALLLWLW